MKQIILDLPTNIHNDIWNHLLPARFMNEEAAFIYVKQTVSKEASNFNFIEWHPVPPEGFQSRSAYHFELTDKTRGSVIKRAHDLNASLVELHSHAGHFSVQFSPTDFMGFQEFVPHILWRLKKRPYIAVVVSRAGIDGLAWLNDSDKPCRLTGVNIGTNTLKTTGGSFNRRHEYYGK